MRINVADTSIGAFHANQSSGVSSRQREHILCHIEKSGGDWSIGEVAHMLSMQKSTVSARLNELLADGLVVEFPKRKDRFSGVKIRPVGLPPLQGGLFQ